MAITYLQSRALSYFKSQRRPFLQWLGFSFLLCSLFPIDSFHFKERQMGSWLFKTFSYHPSPWQYKEPIQAYLFFPNTSKVRQEIRTFFDQVPQNRMTVTYLDHALEPDLAKKLKVRDNGYVVFVRGEGDEEQIERVKIGTDFDAARRKLKKLDEEVREDF